MSRRPLRAALSLLVLGAGLAALLARGTGPGPLPRDDGATGADRPTQAEATRAGLAARAAGGEEAEDPGVAAADPPPPPGIGGVVVDPEGRPVAQAEVRVHSELDPTAASTGLVPRGRTGTDAEGRFSLPAVPAAARWIEVDGRPEFSVRVVRLSGDERDLRVALERRRVVTVTVLDPEGRPLRGALATVAPVRDEPARPDRAPPWRPRGADWTDFLVFHARSGGEASTDRAGTARVRVDPGRATVGVLPPLGSEALAVKGVPVEGDSVVVRLERAFEVTGRALDAEGNPASEAYVAWRLPGGPWKSKRVSHDGEFGIGGLPRGVIEVRAQLDPAPPDPDGPGVETATGRRDLALTVDPGAELRVRVEDGANPAGGTVVLFPQGQRVARDLRLEAPISPAGEAVFGGLRRDGTYFLQAWMRDGKRTATWRGTVPADGRVVMRLVETGSLRVFVDAEGPVTVLAVDVGGFETRPSLPRPPHEEFLLEGLPHGPLRVVVHAVSATNAMRRLSGSAEGEVPGSVRVRLEPESPGDGK